MHYIQPADRQQLTMMNCLDDLIAPDHFVRLLDYAVDRIVQENSLHFASKGQSCKGRRAYSPNTMLKLYLYGYLQGISSSRKLEKECYRNIEVMWLLGNLKPDHKTIADYRKDYGDHITLVSKKFRQFLKDQGFIKAQRVAVDGTRVKANANRDMLTDKKITRRMQRIAEQIKDYLRRLEKNDELDELEEADESLLQEPSEMTRQLLKKIAQLQEKLEKLSEEKQRLEKEKLHSISPTDPQARLMKHPYGFIPAYNIQMVVDAHYHMIGAMAVSQDTNDTELLQPMVEKFQEELAVRAQEVIADGGYYSISQIEALESNNIKCYVAIAPKSTPDGGRIQFDYDADKDIYRCSTGGRLVLVQKRKEKNGQFYKVYRGIDCGDCARRSECTKSSKGRLVHRPYNQKWRERYQARMQSVLGKQMLKLRRNIAEHPFGTIRYWMGQIPLYLRGKLKVSTEMHLYITAYNFRRLISVRNFDEIMEMMQAYHWKLA